MDEEEYKQLTADVGDEVVVDVDEADDGVADLSVDGWEEVGKEVGNVQELHN